MKSFVKKHLETIKVISLASLILGSFCGGIGLAIYQTTDHEGDVKSRYWQKNICLEPVEQRKFVLSCIEKANPMSDEEPEDYILQCQHTAQDLFCEFEYGYNNFIYTNDKWVQLND